MQTYDSVDRPRGANRAWRGEHNRVKKLLIDWAVDWIDGAVDVVDLACGKGGDLGKWAQHGCVRSYVGVDVSLGALQEAQRRAGEDHRTQAFRFEHADVRLYNVPPCSIVSLQFALHYLCHDEATIALLWRRVGAALRPGGLLLVTTVDERAIEGPSDFGCKYVFELPGCIDATQEYKVPFEDVRRLAREEGHLHLCFVRNFHHFLQGAGHKSDVEASQCYVACAFTKV